MARGKKTGGKDFLPGKPPGPGRTPLPQEIKAVQALSLDEARRRISEVIKLPTSTLQRMAEDSEIPVLEMYLARCALLGMKRGDMTALNCILDRLLGKPKETVETHNININADLDKIPREKIIELLRNADAGKPADL
jgi:hypothetical protein